MEITFITIHDLTPEARILYSSDSIVDVLGHTPDEVVGHSTWQFFHPTQVEVAQKLHDRSITMDRASVLTYCDIVNRDGNWVRCECCFSIVYNVMVACTSVYRDGHPAMSRRAAAPIVRRLFASSPKDPRYHMLQHLSSRFQRAATEESNEPRAAMFLNRFTRTLTIMYATSGIEEVLGIPGEDMKGRSFYYCIAESCLGDALRCVEMAKGNDSIAYLRFLFRDPRQDDEPSEDTPTESEDTDAEMTDVGASESESDPESTASNRQSARSNETMSSGHNESNGSGGSNTNTNGPTNSELQSPTASTGLPLELEAVVSCSSDGLVVCLRRARPLVPNTIQDTYMPVQPPQPQQPYTGFFAAPWGHEAAYGPYVPPGYGPTAYPGMPQAYGGPPPGPPAPANGQVDFNFLQAIQECGVFAWDLVGINGTLAEVARGEPIGDAAPHGGAPVWDPSGPMEPVTKRDSGSSSEGRGTMSASSGGDVENQTYL